MAVSGELADADSRSLHEFSDGEVTLITNGGMMKKYKSADDLESGLSSGIDLSIYRVSSPSPLFFKFEKRRHF